MTKATPPKPPSKTPLSSPHAASPTFNYSTLCKKSQAKSSKILKNPQISPKSPSFPLKNSPKKSKISPNSPPKSQIPQKLTYFLLIGILGTALDFIIFSVFNLLIFQPPQTLTPSLWQNPLFTTALSSIIAGLIATLVNFYLHSHFTWQSRRSDRRTLLGFLAWNATVVFLLRPLLITALSLLAPIYHLAYTLSAFLRLPFSQNFITSTGIYGFMTIITMTLNFFIYERLIFRAPKASTPTSTPKSSTPTP